MCIGDISHQITGRKPLKGGFIMAQGLRCYSLGGREDLAAWGQGSLQLGQITAVQIRKGIEMGGPHFSSPLSVVRFLLLSSPSQSLHKLSGQSKQLVV